MAFVYTRAQQTAVKFGTHEILMSTPSKFGNPYADVDLKVEFLRPDGSKVTVDGFYDGGNTFKARAYCDMTGKWQWNSVSNNSDLDMRSGFIDVIPSLLKGKLRIHPDDPYQFAYDNGEWFLHIGDTGYRYVVDFEPNWKEYIDQAAVAGMTKIRVWFCQDRSDVQSLFQHSRKFLNLSYWQEIDRRMVYALNNYPDMMIQIVLYGEDAEEIKKYCQGDVMSRLAGRYAQARFSSFANVHWCISNDLMLSEGSSNYIEWNGKDTIDKKDIVKGIKDAASDIKNREPWGTLVTNHQSRFSGYIFAQEPWSDIITLEHLGQITGENILEYRSKGKCPVVLDEDRYECWRAPKHDRYFFRRLMWASLLSGGHATYGGLKTYEQFDGGLSGMHGYYDACRDGKLEYGAHDFINIHKFFKDSGLTLVDMLPDDNVAKNQPLLYKVGVKKDKSLYVIYLANPDVFQGHLPNGIEGYYTDEFANEADVIPSVELALSQRRFLLKWFDPSTGEWFDGGTVKGERCSLIAPAKGDWIALLSALQV